MVSGMLLINSLIKNCEFILPIPVCKGYSFMCMYNKGKPKYLDNVVNISRKNDMEALRLNSSAMGSVYP